MTMFFGVSTVYSRLLTLLKIEEQLRTVLYYFTAVAPMPVGIIRERIEAIVYEDYGLTETCPFASYNHDFCYGEGSIGSPIENVEMKIVDAQRYDLPPGEPGEIATKGRISRKGASRRPEETGEVMRGEWFRTGDIGQMESDGYFTSWTGQGHDQFLPL
jgi:long-chain acyl-CoA synthetase